MSKLTSLFFFLLLSIQVFGQQPPYTKKYLLSTNDGSFKDVNIVKKNGITTSAKDGKTTAYIINGTSLYDISDDKKSSIRIDGNFLLCFEGNWKNGKKEGIFSAYVIDSLDRKRRYKIYDQEYKNDKMMENGNSILLADHCMQYGLLKMIV